VFSAQPETRACISTLLGPDCRGGRKSVSEESSGIDRTFQVPTDGSWRLSGTAVARSTLGTVSLLNPLGTDVVLHASSQWLADPAVSVRMAYDGATTTSWIADPRDGSPTLTLDFDRPRTIDRLTVGAPAGPAVAPTRAVVRSAQGTREVPLGAFGQFPPLRTAHLTITFSNATRGLAPIGLSELYLEPTKVARPLDGADPTGAPCGLGPVLTVDGRRYDTAVTGLIGDVVAAGPLHFEACSGPVRLTAGTHSFRLRSTEQFQPVTALLRSPSTRPDGADRTISTPTGSATHQTMTVGAGAASLLSTTRNVNAGWRATLDGRPLRAAISDGWAQAWQLPAGKGGRVVISYAPQTPYLVSLYAGLGAALLVLLVGLVVLVRTRLRPLTLPTEREPGRPTRSRWLVAVALLLPVSWLLGGVPALIGVALGAGGILLRRPALLRRAGVVLLVAAPVLVAWQLRDGPVLRFDLADLLAGTGFALALMSLLPPPLPRTTTP
jgi:arabinofuranan 3-O-arabinosyltransferase